MDSPLQLLSNVLSDHSSSIPETATEHDPVTISNSSGSLGVLLLALGASEFVAFLIFRCLAWYTDMRFYARERLDWIHSDSDSMHDAKAHVAVEVLAKSLHHFDYEPNENTDTCCPICLGEFVDVGENIVHGNCLHSFHEPCLLQWLEVHESCPCCRQPVLSPTLPQLKRDPSQADIHGHELRRLYMSHWLPYLDATSADFLFIF